jgi:hypothetical protein
LKHPFCPAFRSQAGIRFRDGNSEWILKGVDEQ